MTGMVRLFSLACTVAAAVAAVCFLKPPVFETSLGAIAGKDAVSLPDSIQRAVSSRMQVVASAKSLSQAQALAEKFVASLDTELRDSVRFRVDGGSLPEVIGFYRRNRGGFMSPDDRRLGALDRPALLKKVFARIASPSPSLFAFGDDPCRFLDDFVKTLPRGFGQWQVRGDVLAAEKDGLFHVLVSLAVPEAAAFDIKKLPAFLSPIVAAVEKLSADSPTATLSLCGVPAHTYETSVRCERQIGALSVFSLSFILVLALVVLRSFKAIGLIVLNLALSAAAAFAVVNLVFDSIHLIALVFGTTLIGIAVDYSFHRILTAKQSDIKTVRGNLLKSYLTTVVSLVPLAFSGIGFLFQAALFLSAGLTMSMICNLLLPAVRTSCDTGGDTQNGVIGKTKINKLPAVVALAVLPCLFAVDFRTEARDLHSPSEKLQAAERLISGLSGLDRDAGMVVVTGDCLEDVLAKEERFPGECLSLSKFVPPLEVRLENHRLIKAFHAGSGKKLAKMLGFDGDFPPPPPPRRLETSDIPASIAEQFLFAGDNGEVMTLIPRVSKATADALRSQGAEDFRFYAPKAMLSEMLNRYERKILFLLIASFAAVVLLLWRFYRARSFLIILPSLSAISVMFAVVSCLYGHVNLFHLLASFMIVGMALDYTIFLVSDFRHGLKAVICSLLTSMAGFGALAFVSFPIVSAVGVALGLGLPLSFFAVWFVFRPSKETDERAATPLGLEISWVVYRLFGKRALDAIAWTVAHFVWLFDAKARKASSSRRRLVNFALSLGDKIAVLSNGRGQPEISLDGSGDAEAFIADVAAKKGVVVISSHLGNVETLAAYGECSAKFHVFMALSLTGVFRAFKERHARRSMIEVHPTEGFSMAELFLGGEIVEDGDVVLIAGDRGGGRQREMPFLGGKRCFPEGAFRFAKHLECPVYFVASVREKGGYRVFAKRLGSEGIIEDYVRELERLVKLYPDQWYQWENEGCKNG